MCARQIVFRDLSITFAAKHHVFEARVVCYLSITVHLNVTQQAFEHLSVVFVCSAANWLDDDLWSLCALFVDDLAFHRRVAVDRQAWPVRSIANAFRLLRPLNRLWRT